VLDTLAETLEEDKDAYRKFWNEFGRVLKEGIYHDPKNREKLLELALFRTTKTEKDELVTLKQVVERMAEGQDKIYYLTGDARDSLIDSPHLETFKKEGIEVLLLTDSVDEVWLNTVPDFEGKSLVSAAGAELEIGTDDERKARAEEKEKTQKEMATFISWMQSRLGNEVKEVRVSSRLVDSPACLVADAGDMSANLERLMRAMGQEVPTTKRILEINAHHPLIEHLSKRYESEKDTDELGRTVNMVYQLAVLSEGGELQDPAGFAKQVASVLSGSLASAGPSEPSAAVEAPAPKKRGKKSAS
jgi:molecular chaperone HtpG